MSTAEKMTPWTPGEWEVMEVMGQVFVAAPPYKGHDYCGLARTIEIMSDEDYPTKLADARLIAQAPVMAELLLRAYTHVTHGKPTMGEVEKVLRDAGAL